MNVLNAAAPHERKLCQLQFEHGTNATTPDTNGGVPVISTSKCYPRRIFIVVAVLFVACISPVGLSAQTIKQPPERPSFPEQIGIVGDTLFAVGEITIGGRSGETWGFTQDNQCAGIGRFEYLYPGSKLPVFDADQAGEQVGSIELTFIDYVIPTGTTPRDGLWGFCTFSFEFEVPVLAEYIIIYGTDFFLAVNYPMDCIESANFQMLIQAGQDRYAYVNMVDDCRNALD